MYDIAVTIIILLVGIILYATKPISYLTTSIAIMVSLTLTGILEPGEIFIGFTNSGVILATSMFIIGGSILSSGVASKIGKIITKHVKTEKSAMIAIMIASLALSSFLSNLGTATVMLPIVLGLCQSGGYRPSKLLMPMAFACSYGGINTLAGQPLNVLLRALLEEGGHGTIKFFEFAKLGIPLSITLLLYMYFLGYKILPNRKIDLSKLENIQKNQSESKKNQIASFLIFTFTILAMIFEKQIGVPIHISALFGVFFILIFNVMTDSQAINSIDWGANSLVIAMIPMANALEKTGVAAIFTRGVISVLGENPNPLILIGIVFIISSILTQFMSNTATAALTGTIALSIGSNLDYNPKILIMSVVAASTIAITPIGTPCNTIVIGYGNYSFLDYLKLGIPLLVISMIVTILLIPVIWG